MRAPQFHVRDRALFKHLTQDLGYSAVEDGVVAAFPDDELRWHLSEFYKTRAVSGGGYLKRDYHRSEQTIDTMESLVDALMGKG